MGTEDFMANRYMLEISRLQNENATLKKRVDTVEKWHLDLMVERGDLKKRVEELEEAKEFWYRQWKKEYAYAETIQELNGKAESDLATCQKDFYNLSLVYTRLVETVKEVMDCTLPYLAEKRLKDALDTINGV